MLSEKLLIGVRGIGDAGALPLPVLGELRDACARFCRELAVRVPLEKFPVALDGVRGFGRTPVLLLAAASDEHRNRDH
jgi:hypothetical protein